MESTEFSARLRGCQAALDTLENALEPLLRPPGAQDAQARALSIFH